MNSEVRILEPGQTGTPRGQIRFLSLPARNVFTRRAERFRFLSKDHPFGEYLNFLGLLSDAQQKALNQFPSLSLPDQHEEAQLHEEGIPPFDSGTWFRDAAWRAALKTILQHMKNTVLPPAANNAVAVLMQASETRLEEIASRLLAREMIDISPQEMPFVSAALQVYWVSMASSLSESACGRPKESGLCPVCGSRPVAGIVYGSGIEQGMRYLCCSLCASEWHMVRLKCSTCESTEGIDYHILEGSNGAVKIESCKRCNSYLKLLYLGKDPHMEATADDLATLSLDMLIGQEGKARGGPNLLFHPGEVPVRAGHMNPWNTA